MTNIYYENNHRSIKFYNKDSILNGFVSNNNTLIVGSNDLTLNDDKIEIFNYIINNIGEFIKMDYKFKHRTTLKLRKLIPTFCHYQFKITSNDLLLKLI